MLIQNLLIILAYTCLAFLLEKVGLAHQNQNSEYKKTLDSLVGRNPFLFFFLGAVVAPVWEEAVFRLIPIWIAGTNVALLVFLTTLFTSVFIFGHKITSWSEVYPRLIISFVLTGYMIVYGFWAAVLFHAMNNAIMLSIYFWQRWSKEMFTFNVEVPA